MQIITTKTRPIMLITGLLTCTMAYSIFFPEAALISMFGESLASSALAEIVVRSWGILITLIGAMLIYGALNIRERPLILTIAGLSKLSFIGLLIGFGGQYFPHTNIPILIDGITVILFMICLPSARRAAQAV